MSVETAGDLARIHPLLRPNTTIHSTGRGYLDLLGAKAAMGGSAAQRAMANRLVARIYQRIWRPIGVRALSGYSLSTAAEVRRGVAALDPKPGEAVLDVACGPGVFTRPLARRVGPDGVAVGVDASTAMLTRAVAAGAGGPLGYAYADARTLPFRDGVFDAVGCFAALYLIPEPERVVDEIVRVLAPGGRVALLTSAEFGAPPIRTIANLVAKTAGGRTFGRGEIAGWLEQAGLTDVVVDVRWAAQFVTAVRPD